MYAYLRPVFWAVLSLVVTAAAWADTPDRVEPADPLATLSADHPRLFASEADFDRVAQLIETDERAAQWYDALKQQAQAMLDQPAPLHELRDGRRLLYVSREVRDRVFTLALLDRIEPDDRYRDRVWQDMQAVAAFEDWNPDHFLDVAEMAFACGLAYDWMYDRWSAEQRQTIRDAIVRLGLQPGLNAYEQNHWWTRTKINWNQVCNGGLIAAALAIADEEPEMASRYIGLAVESLKISMARYAPDGGYEEGPGYWGYGTAYNVFAIAVLDSALGQNFGLSDMTGFDVTGGFPIQMTGATGRLYNFADGTERAFRSPALFYFASRYNHPAYARYAAEHNSGTPLDLLWYDPDLLESQENAPPLAIAYQSAGVAVMRSAWDDSDAWFVGAKGGWTDFGHAQLDLGSFILERHGVRWFVELGLDNYNLPGYFHLGANGHRWRYYRNRAEGHNAFVINPGQRGPDQPTDARAAITCQDNTIQIDLSDVYPGEVGRTITLDTDADQVRLVDRYAIQAPADGWWFAHTRAQVQLADDGRSAVLSQDGQRLRTTIVAPDAARFVVMDARPLPGSPDPVGQNPNNGATITNAAGGSRMVMRGQTPQFSEPNPALAYRKLAIHLESITQGRVEVVFEPID